jgi:hypothetical protein
MAQSNELTLVTNINNLHILMLAKNPVIILSLGCLSLD